MKTIKITVLFVGIFLLSLSGAVAQLIVKGTVTSANDGLGLPGVSVTIKGTKTEIFTDIDGHYLE